MAEGRTKQPDRALFITGAFNPSLKLFRPTLYGAKRAMLSPVGEAHFQRIGTELHARDVPSGRPIVLESMGIQHPEKTRNQVLQQIEKRLQKYENDRFMLVGHSLGGVMLTHLIGEGEFDDQVIGAVTSGSPHEGTNDDFFRPLYAAAKVAAALRFLPFDVKAIQDHLPDFAEEGLRGAAQAVESGEHELHFIGSIDDAIVPVESALSAKANAVRHLVGRATVEQWAHDVHQNDLGESVSHVQLLTNQHAAAVTADVVVGDFNSTQLAA